MNRLTSALCFYVVLSITTLGTLGGGDMGDDPHDDLSGFIAHSEAAKSPADKGAVCTVDQQKMDCCTKLFGDKDGGELEWQTSDNGKGGKWTGGADFIQFDIANDVECGGSSDEPQTGEAIMHFDVKEGEGTTIILSMRGVAESKYETFEMFLDGESIVTVQADDTTTCQVHTCNMCEVHMKEKELHLNPGHHNIKITIDTIDGFYHSNAYFRIEFEVVKPEPCNDANGVVCSCPPPGKSNYVAIDNGPGCESGMNVKEEDCKTAASQLGFEGSLQVGSWSWAPPGCLVGHPTDGWKKLYYNKFTNGTLGRDIYKSVCKSKKRWSISLPQTMIGGPWIKNGTPLPAKIAFDIVDEDAWIVGLIEGGLLKMVKLRVTGPKSYDWISAKYSRPGSYPHSCSLQSTFSESCFVGENTSERNYQVQLVATAN